MIRLNVYLQTEDESRRKPLVEAATELVELSLRDKGCIDYDLYASTTNDDRFMIIETWDNERDLERHEKSEHFRRIVPRLKELATMTITKFEF